METLDCPHREGYSLHQFITGGVAPGNQQHYKKFFTLQQKTERLHGWKHRTGNWDFVGLVLALPLNGLVRFMANILIPQWLHILIFK